MVHTHPTRLSLRLQEQLHSEQQEVNAITQPLLVTEAGFIKVIFSDAILSVTSESFVFVCVSTESGSLPRSQRRTGLEEK